MSPVTLFPTVTLFLPGIGPRLAMLEFPMPDLVTCESKGRVLVAGGDGARTFAFVCRERA